VHAGRAARQNAVVAFAMIASGLGLDDQTRLELEIAGFVLPFAAYLSSVLLQLSPSMRWAKRTKEILISERAISVGAGSGARESSWRSRCSDRRRSY